MAARSDGYNASVQKYRYTWTMPIVFSPHDPNILYHSSQFLFRSKDGGHSWETISPDLTRNDKSKQQDSGGPITKDQASIEFYDLIFTVAESPKQKGLIWVGTDDGLIQLTRDDGKNWTNVTPKGFPEWAMISLIEPSPFEAGTAYAAIDAHKLDDFKPYVFKTTDFGKTWLPITAGLPDGSTFTPFAKIPSARACSMPARKRAHGFPLMTARTGKLCSSICRQLRSTTSSSTVTTWSSPLMAARSGCSMTSARCARRTPRLLAKTRTCSRLATQPARAWAIPDAAATPSEKIRPTARRSITI